MGHTSSELLEASRTGDVAGIDAALAAGASISANYYNGWSPYPMDSVTNVVWEAAYHGHLPAVKRLLAAGGSIRYVDEEGRSAVYMAALRGHAPVVRELLAAGASPLGGEPRGEPVIAVAVQSGSLETVEALLEANAHSWLPAVLAPRIPQADIAAAFRVIAFARNDAGPAMGRLLLAHLSPSSEDVGDALTRAASVQAGTVIEWLLGWESGLVPIHSHLRNPAHLTTILTTQLRGGPSAVPGVRALHRAGGFIAIGDIWAQATRDGSLTLQWMDLALSADRGCLRHAAWEQRRVAVIAVALRV